MATTVATHTNKEQVNGIRLLLWRQKIDKYLRIKVEEKFSSDAFQIYEEFEKKRKLIEDLQKRKIISEIQFNLLLPRNRQCDLSQYDASLLGKVLFNIDKNDVPYKRPKKHLIDSDRSTAANIYRVIKIRDEIHHKPVAVPDRVYKSITKEAEQSLIELGCSVEEIKQDVTEISIVDEQTKERMQKMEKGKNSFTFNILSPVINFMGREDEINELHQHMMKYYAEVNNPLMGVVLNGLSGVGKSELLRKYCQKYLDIFYKGNGMWINAQNVDTITNDFLKIGEEIGLTMIQADGSLQPIKTIVQHIYNYFVLRSSNEPQRKVMFVFDNLNSPDDIKKFLPNISNSPYIIITSQSKDWDLRFKFIDLNVFSPETAKLFMQENMKDILKKNEQANELLLRILDGHPLALQQAITYINRHDMNVETYINLFQQYYDKLLLTDRDHKTALTTILLSIDNMTKQTGSAVAMKLLRISAYFDGRDIKKGLLLMFTSGNIAELNEALNLLYEYSFIARQDMSGQDEIKFEQQILTVHPLIQFALKHNQRENDLEEELLENIFDSFFKDLNSKKNLVEKGKYWFPHFLHLFHQNDTKESLLLHSLHQLTLLTDIFETKGRLKKMLEIAEKQLQLTKDSNEIGFITQTHIARIFSKLGNNEEALETLRNVEKKQLSILGENDPSLLTTQHNIGLELSSLGKNEEALETLRNVEKKQLSILGENHPSLLTTQHNIGRELSSLGKNEEALETLRNVEKKQLSILGENHPSLLTTQHNIGRELSSLGKNEEALETLRNVEKKKLSILGENHPSLLTTQHNIGLELSSLRKNEEALETLRNVEKKQLSILGENHPSLLTTQHNIAQELSSLGKNEEALETFRNVEKKDLSILGENHPSLLTTQHNIGRELSSLGKNEEALETLRNVEKKELSILGENHPSLLTTQHNIAQELSSLGKNEEALETLRNVEKKDLSILGENHPSLLTTQHNIGRELSSLGKNEEALETLRNVEKKQLSILGENHPSLLTTQHNIGRELSSLGKNEEALETLRNVEKKQLSILGENHPSLLTTQHNIGRELSSLGKNEEALETLRNVEKKQLSILGENHPSLLTTQRNIAQVLRNVKKEKRCILL